MSIDQLALYGGDKLLKQAYEERWKKISPPAIEAIVNDASRDISTSFGKDSPAAEFEAKFADYVGAKYALAMNSGTAALHSAYYAVGIRPGDEVIVPAYTFCATATPLLQLGAIPVFADIDEDTRTLCVEDVSRKITPATKAVCVVHVYGIPANMDRLSAICKANDVALIEDCSHAHGAVYKGKSLGSWGDVGCFSVQSNKALSGGEAGIVTTDDATLYDRMLALGHLGRTATEQKADTFIMGNVSFGLKYRPHHYAMLLALESLSRLDELNELRRRHYQTLCQRLSDVPGIYPATIHDDSLPGGMVAYGLRLEPSELGNWNRGAVVHALNAEGAPAYIDGYAVSTEYGPFTLPNMEIFRRLPELAESEDLWAYKHVDLRRYRKETPPVADRVCRQLICLPPFTDVEDTYVEACADAMVKVARILNAESA